MDWSPADVAALLTAGAAFVGAIAGIIYQLRMMRRDIVSAVEAHLLGTQAVMREERRKGCEDG